MFSDDKPNGNGEVLKEKYGKRDNKKLITDKSAKKENISLRKTVELKSTQLHK